MAKLLLSSVFGPFGVDDDYGRKENVLELLHNQVTREQGLFSPRYHSESFGLHFLAENIETPATVLDFPSQKRFVRELRRGYDYVGISFITPNFIKAKRMSELVRKHSPRSKIILGGHGAQIPGIEEMIDHDHLCREEGVAWLRRLLGEDPDRPFRHPALQPSFAKRILGIPVPSESAVLIPGVGCPNACRFCSTSHLFRQQYVSFFETGRELFDILVDLERKIGCREFFIMDENFLKKPDRARELLQLMEENDKPYRFAIFSSAETVKELGVEFLARLGVWWIWVGAESKFEIYRKNSAVDLKEQIAALRSHGISVLASAILFLEQHDKETIWEDIRFAVDLESDFLQFMQLGPMPGTKLYRDYDEKGLLRKDLPFEEWHGQHRLWFRHPNFTPEESEQYLRDAFRYDFDIQGSSLLRMADTSLRGYRTLARYRDPWMQRRRADAKERMVKYRPMFPSLWRHAHNLQVRALTEMIMAGYDAALGPMTGVQKLMSKIASLYAWREARRVAAGRNVYQPKTIRTDFRTAG